MAMLESLKKNPKKQKTNVLSKILPAQFSHQDYMGLIKSFSLKNIQITTRK